MSTNHKNIRLSTVALAVVALISSTMVYADEQEEAALKQPTNTVEIGVTNLSQDSAKFGEYGGPTKSGSIYNGNINIRGGKGYSKNEDGETNRWSITGDNLGLKSRSINATASNQGEWSFGVGYDELQHNLTDGYRTPYTGTMGGQTFTLGSGFTSTSTTATTDASGSNFNAVDVYSSRKNSSLNGSMILNSQWTLQFDYNLLKQDGAKLMAFASAGNQNLSSANGQKIAILPNPTNYKTDTVQISANWVGEQAQLSFSYLGSFFKDEFDHVSFANFSDKTKLQSMSTVPNNIFNQMSVAGSYVISEKTKMTGNLSYARNQQNQAYSYDAFMYNGTPAANSLNGVVVTSHADVKVINKASKDLTLSTGIKYDERDNQTDSKIYNFYAVNYPADNAIYANTPLSTKKLQLDLASDYRLEKNKYLKLAYTYNDIERSCHQYAIAANCVVAKSTAENQLDLTLRDKISDDIGYKLGYAYNVRRTDSDPLAITSMISQFGGYSGGLGYLIADKVRGVNGGDYLGFYPIFNASRNQSIYKASATLQPNEKLNVTFSGRFTQDNYVDTTYGAQNGRTWTASLDTGYNYSEDGVVNGYVTRQFRTRDIHNYRYSYTSASVYTSGGWTNTLNDNDISVGLGFKQSGFATPKLDVAMDLSRTLGLTGYDTQIDSTYTVKTTTATTTGCAAAAQVCGSTPTIRNTLTQVKLSGLYTVDKASKFVMRLIHQRLDSSDYFYNAYQGIGNAPTGVMPTNQSSGSYSINAVTASFIHSF